MQQYNWGPVELGVGEPHCPYAFGCDSNAGKVFEGVSAAFHLWVYEGSCRRQQLSCYVVVRDKYVKAVALGIVYLFKA